MKSKNDAAGYLGRHLDFVLSCCSSPAEDIHLNILLDDSGISLSLREIAVLTAEYEAEFEALQDEVADFEASLDDTLQIVDAEEDRREARKAAFEDDCDIDAHVERFYDAEDRAMAGAFIERSPW